MQKATRHTTPFFMRSAAFVTLILLLMVRFGALIHTHTDNNINNCLHFASTTSQSLFTVASSTDSHANETSDIHDESCSLCDYLITTHSEVASEQTLMLCTALIAVFLLASVIFFRTYSPLLRLADRAPPTFAALA